MLKLTSNTFWVSVCFTLPVCVCFRSGHHGILKLVLTEEEGSLARKRAQLIPGGGSGEVHPAAVPGTHLLPETAPQGGPRLPVDSNVKRRASYPGQSAAAATGISLSEKPVKLELEYGSGCTRNVRIYDAGTLK